MNEDLRERVATIDELVDELICKKEVTKIDLDYGDRFSLKTYIRKDDYYHSNEIEPDRFDTPQYTILIIRK
jgi:hypothetical protein